MVGDIFQPTHLLFVLVIALLVLGPKRLPEVGQKLGSGIRDFRQAINGESNHTRPEREEPDYIHAPPETANEPDIEPVAAQPAAAQPAAPAQPVAAQPAAPQPAAPAQPAATQPAPAPPTAPQPALAQPAPAQPAATQPVPAPPAAAQPAAAPADEHAFAYGSSESAESRTEPSA